MSSKSQRNVRKEPPADAILADSPEPPGAATGSTRPKARASSEPKIPAAERFPRIFKAITGAKIMLGVAIVASASVAVAWGAKRYMTSSPRFAIKTVQIDGHSRKSPQEVAAIGGIAIGENVFSVDLDLSRRKIEDDPWIKSATVTRKLPGSLVVTVVEHEPVLLVAIEDKLYLASRGGDVFKEALPDDPLDMPVVTGIGATDVVRDRDGVQKDVQRALDVLDELARTTIVKRYPLQEIHLVKDGTVEVTVGQGGIALHLGAMPYRGKLEQAERVFDELAKRKTEPSIIFLDNESSPDRVVVRVR